MIKLYCGDIMGLFTKKFDLEKDRLMIRFDLDERRYQVYIFNGEAIDYKFLNRKTKKILDKKNSDLENNNELMQNEIKTAKTIKRFRKLNEMGYTCNSFEVMGNIHGSMSKEMEEYLTKLTSEENVLLGIHRVGFQLSQEQIEDILINGLKITSHQGSGAVTNKQLSDNVSYYPDNGKIIKELMYANTYKNSTGSILIRIPDCDLTGNIFITNESGETLLNPKYILGYVPVNARHHIETIIRPQQVINKRNDSSDLDIVELYDQLYSTEETVEERNKTM